MKMYTTKKIFNNKYIISSSRNIFLYILINIIL